MTASKRKEQQTCSTRMKSSKLSALLDYSLDPETGEEQEEHQPSSQSCEKEARVCKTREGSEKVKPESPCKKELKACGKSKEGEGDALCMVLLAAYDGVQLGSTSADGRERRCVISALSSLLAISHSAKHSALQGSRLLQTVRSTTDLFMIRLYR